MDEFIAAVKLFAGNFAPRGWAFCDGSTLQISQYQALFALIGTTYGGNGTTDFKLPDLRSRVPVGAGQGTGLTSRPAGQLGGSEAVALTTAQLPAHNHLLLASAAAADLTDPSAASLAQLVDGSFMPTTPIYTKSGPAVQLAANSIGLAGNSAPHDNLPPFLAMSYIICLEGLFPARP